MNQFRKVAAGSWLGRVVGFSQDLNVSRLHCHYLLLAVPDHTVTTPHQKMIISVLSSYRLENPGNEGLQAGVLSLAGQEEEMAP